MEFSFNTQNTIVTLSLLKQFLVVKHPYFVFVQTYETINYDILIRLHQIVDFQKL